jgi:hypothetical protein
LLRFGSRHYNPLLPTSSHASPRGQRIMAKKSASRAKELYAPPSMRKRKA